MGYENLSRPMSEVLGARLSGCVHSGLAQSCGTSILSTLLPAFVERSFTGQELLGLHRGKIGSGRRARVGAQDIHKFLIILAMFHYIPRLHAKKKPQPMVS